MAKREEVLFTHMQDPEGKYDLSKAKRGCKHCYSTGLAGRMHLTGVRIVCACVMKRIYEDSQILKQKEEVVQ